MPKPRINPSKIDTSTVGKNLLLYRKKRGLTQKELAEKIGVTRETVAAYEANRGRLLDITLISLTNILNVSSDTLLGLKPIKQETQVSRRLMKRITIVDTFTEPAKKYVLKFLDDTIKSNKRA
jgi:transcriptional regulator with XRE-family HTH domain